MAEIIRVVKKPFRGLRIGFQVDGPVAETLSAANREDDSISMVERNRLDDHGLGTLAPIRVDVALSFGTDGLLIDLSRVSCGQTEKCVGWGIYAPTEISNSSIHSGKSTYSFSGGN